MLFLVCSVVLATGEWDCGKDRRGLPIIEAMAVTIAFNDQFPYKPGNLKSPYTIWPADRLTPDQLPQSTPKEE